MGASDSVGVGRSVPTLPNKISRKELHHPHSPITYSKDDNHDVSW